MYTLFENGQKVKDTITGFTGIIVATCKYLNGCITYEIQPPLNKDGRWIDAKWIDEGQIELYPRPKKAKVTSAMRGTMRGGPADRPARSRPHSNVAKGWNREDA